MICCVRPCVPFRPERFAFHVRCATSYDLLYFKVAYHSVFSDEPAVLHARNYQIEAPHDFNPCRAGPHRAHAPDERSLGRLIYSDVCLPHYDVTIEVRQRANVSSAPLEFLVWGSVLSTEESLQAYRRDPLSNPLPRISNTT